MPIDYKKYPSNWKTEIRPAILQRANNKCECCGLENYSLVHSFKENSKTVWKDLSYGDFIRKLAKTVKVVLTIAHLDHNILNNDFSNLKALCQKCHLDYDKEHHKKNSRETLKKKKGIVELSF